MLTTREHEVLRLVALGFTDQQMARRLGLSPRTVKFYVGKARDKLGADTRAHAVHIGHGIGILTYEGGRGP